ncbi:murein biosynthesis integral membrane protein MurJ [Ruicaihuangia caeni]|uniref:murein biosynthesis integral membrane protein MurJ n=1 Tax=Ruicaihuangia caeni TaxID=3042517 RepID=UPI00338EFA48
MTEAGGGTPSIRRSSALLASGTLVSRVLGFVSAFLLATTLGTVGDGADLFTLANQLPNNIYAIVAGGVLSAVLVPQIVRAGLHADGGAAYVNRLVTLGLVIFAVIGVIATLAAPLLVRLYAQSGEGMGDGLSQAQFGLAVAFAYWCLPQVFFYALYSLLGEVLNGRSVFGPFTWAPVLNNVVAITGILLFAMLYGTAPDHQSVETWTTDRVVLISGSATLGVAAQAVVLFAFWKRAGLRFRLDFRWRGVGLRQTGKSAAWVFGMILITQLAGIVQSNVASLAAGTGEASLAVLRFAWLIFMLPHGIATVSIVTAYFTRMSTHARDGDFVSLRADVAASLRTTGLIMVFSSLGLIAIAYPFAAVFGGGFKEIEAMALVLIAYLLGLVPFSMLFVLQRTFYALEDTRTPFLVQAAQAVVFVLGMLVVAQLPLDRIAIGVAVTVTIAGTLQTALAWVLLRRKLGTGGQSGTIVREHVRYTVAMLPAAAAGALIVWLLGGFQEGGFAVSGVFEAGAVMVLAGTVMALIYAVLLLLMRNRELLEFMRPVVARLRRR